MKTHSSFFIKLLFAGLVMLMTSTGFAQVKPDTAKSNKPVMTASIGPYTGGKALTGDIKRLMGLNPLVKVKDAKGLEYKVVAFEITWKKKELSDDIKTGKPKIIYYLVGADVKSNQLPESWREEMSADIQAGEEITLSSILYTDPKKKINYKWPGAIVISVL